MKIYTKTGDHGETSLYGGTRVSKADARVEAFGTIDELNAFIGFARAKIKVETVAEELKKIQYDLFTIGAEVATPKDKLTLANGKPRLSEFIDETHTHELERWIDTHQETLPEQEYFILPAGGEASSALHIARTVCRRTERTLVQLNHYDPLRQEVMRYFNRLSDYLFVLTRVMAFAQNEPEDYWIPKK